MNWSTKSLRKLIHSKQMIPKREKIKLEFQKDDSGKNITETHPTYPPPDSDWHKFYGKK